MATKDVPKKSKESRTDADTLGAFQPKDLTQSSPTIQIDNQKWTSILSTPCDFAPQHFLYVCDNLLRNPNITSSVLFRAEILYDSENDAGLFSSLDADGKSPSDASSLIVHLKEEYRPLSRTISGYQIKRTVVRKLIPRNPQLDQSLVQTVHFFERDDANRTTNLVLYTPHIDSPANIPYYHPKVHALAVAHSYEADHVGELSMHYALSEEHPLDNRLSRIALKFLQITHKHATGQGTGYTKKVLLDQIVPQKRTQDTYTRLKATYAKSLVMNWAEKTDPLKHVFEDLAIAAFLIELWRDMYGEQSRDEESKFPGFIDLGCGNGVLVYILVMEGYSGWGFDARARKSWDIFPEPVRDHLKESILVPEMFSQRIANESSEDQNTTNDTFHSGVFPAETFIISNHADELTPWTPILAYLSSCSFIAIPCCSHNLTGARHRFAVRPKGAVTSSSGPESPKSETMDISKNAPSANEMEHGPGPASGSLAKGKKGPAPPSAYASLTAYLILLAEEVGFKVEQETLRIPSTRNVAILGRRPTEESLDTKHLKLTRILEREIGDIDKAAKNWVEQAIKLQKGTGSNH